MIVGLIIATLIGLAIYSLSRVESDLVAKYTPTPEMKGTAQRDFIKELSPYAEGGWMLVSFWSITCVPCLTEMPSLNRLSQMTLPNRFKIITVNVDQDTEPAKHFLIENDLEIPTLFDKNRNWANALGVESIPKHFLVNPENKIVWEALGAFRWDAPEVQDQITKWVTPQAEAAVSNPEE